MSATKKYLKETWYNMKTNNNKCWDRFLLRTLLNMPMYILYFIYWKVSTIIQINHHGTICMIFMLLFYTNITDGISKVIYPINK